ncbi:enoyl-CoA hydratase/isomerase family protein [Fictibacillus sp. FJAT-27399]|uniref:enoyl-CoA hydratase/isomerase family protein n=1 Tax=Fictibacillus sp. FJAT-27399 TaxID=1729689 RepID=UPI0009E81E92|nr:enoyl-CoA hydratase/isomerase family protein [Fictibacillus sp. FJAT-27399]
MNQPSVVTETINGIGWIKLNRPSALNSLNVEMVDAIYSKLKEWKNDNQIALICIYGEGKKGLCAGGDMRAFFNLKENEVEPYAEQFFSTEYIMDYEIHHYPKPIVIYMDNIVMGGGVGISIGASHRIVTETTKWAMPEMNIGFFPDVGASFFLNKMPGYTGCYLSLTSAILNAGDVIYIDAADYYLESVKWQTIKQEMENRAWTLDSAKQELDHLLKQHCTSSTPPSSLLLQQEKIDAHFQFDTIEEIVSSLKKEAEKGDQWAEKTLKTILSISPTSLKVTLCQIQEGKEKNLLECFEMEMSLAMNFIKSNDFYEGVRSVLIDKDRAPKWNPSALEDITEEHVDSFFHYEWRDRHPLVNLKAIDKMERLSTASPIK